MEGYQKDFMNAARLHQVPQARVAAPWPTELHFIELLTKRISTALSVSGMKNMPIVFTTHSLPQRVIENDPSYLLQLQKTIGAVRSRLQGNIEWYQAYQSAGHTPEQWLKPDLTDVLRELAKKGHTSVLIVPIQFLADHLEILYDLDIAARAQCHEYGLDYHRIELPNTDSLFIKTLVSIVKGL